MSLSAYDELIEFRPGASRALASWLAAGHFLAGVAILVSALPAWCLLLLPLSLCCALRHALRPCGRGVRGLAWRADTGWARLGIGDIRDSMELRGTSVVTKSAVFMHFDLGGAAWRVLLPRDALTTDEWRRMRVITALHEGRDRMPAALTPAFRGARPNGHQEQRPAAGRKGPAG
ncbi:protein YgfX [Thioalkalivibrio sp. XN279]|uniref:protein YgfX n=1 Tax=Thioalkalivibrio sp. XN279 TaxID=2714953 RepID=UPI00351B3055